MIDGIKRDAPDSPDGVTENITSWVAKVKQSKETFKKDFDRMRFNQQFVRGVQWFNQKELDEDDRYTANFLQHHIKTVVSSLYARNPTVIAKHKDRMNFSLWDEDQASLQAAQQNIMMSQQTGMPINPMDLMLLQDYSDGMKRKALLSKISRTLEIVTKHQIDEQPQDFKLQMKMLVSRVAINGVGYIKTLYQRESDFPRNVKMQIEDVQTKMQTINRLHSDLVDGESDDDNLDAEELRISLDILQSKQKIVTREGLLFEFPKATKIIIDPSCTCIDGFIDASWIAQEYVLTNNQIKEYYQVDIGGTVGDGKSQDDSEETLNKKEETLTCVWEIQDKQTGSYFTVCDGYDDYLKKPSPPSVEIESFFNIRALVFNKADDEKNLYPISDVTILKDIQDEYNRTREALRQHRIANKPLYFAARGTFEEDEENEIANADPHQVIYVNSDGEANLNTKIQPSQKAPIDPNVYQTSDIFEDVQRTVGAPEAQFGGVANTTATESSIAESGRMKLSSSNADDIDDFLTRFFKDNGVILLTNMTAERAKKIAGVGAVWPEMSYEDIIEELYLSVEAGSSGRPNKSHEIANFERLAPILLQLPNINPYYLAKYALKITEDGIDLTEALKKDTPSIMAMNGMQQLGTGDPATDPNQQGSKGSNNAMKANRPQGPSQAMFPSGQM